MVVCYELFVLTAENARRILLDELHVVGGHQDGCTLMGDFPQVVDNELAGLGVEVAGRLVGENQFRPVEQGAGDDDSLLFAA